MNIPYIGEIRLFAFPLVPWGWRPCDGELLSVDDYPELFSRIGTTYGGDGVKTFALPNMQGRLPVHPGVGIKLGDAGGSPIAGVTTAAMPSHSHAALASETLANQGVAPDSTVMLAISNVAPLYTPGAAAPTEMSPSMVASTGESMPHDNVMPYVVLVFCIAIAGR